MAHQNISKKRKFVADGVFYSELNEVRIRPRTAKRGARAFLPGHASGLCDTWRTDTERGARGSLLATGSGKGSCAVVAPTRRSRACVASRRPSVCEVEGCCRSFGDWRLQGGWPIKTIRNERGVLETASHLGTGITSLPGSIGTRGTRTSAAASLSNMDQGTSEAAAAACLPVPPLRLYPPLHSCLLSAFATEKSARSAARHVGSIGTLRARA